MNRNHNLHNRGRFCSRADGRTVDPAKFEQPDDLAAALYKQADRTLAQHEDAFASGGKCLVAERADKTLEFVVLSGEGYDAYDADDQDGRREVPQHKGKVGGVQDGHNIRRGVRRWLGRNEDIMGEQGVALRVVREDNVLRLNAVKA